MYEHHCVYQVEILEAYSQCALIKELEQKIRNVYSKHGHSHREILGTKIKYMA